uniref:Tryptophan 5-hydroxylase 2 n=1 Tax=Capra hircus TaxID=9925 RepID=A0A8C2N6U9_CAPHI
MQPAMMMFSSKYWARRGLSLDSAVPEEHQLLASLTLNKTNSGKNEDKNGNKGSSKNDTATESGKTAVVFSLKNEVGGLVKALKLFQEKHVNMIHIESRKSRRRSSEVEIFVDCECGKTEFNELIQSLKFQTTIVTLNPPENIWTEEEELEDVPWFPRKISELDRCSHRVLMYGSELDADHPRSAHPQGGVHGGRDQDVGRRVPGALQTLSHARLPGVLEKLPSADETLRLQGGQRAPAGRRRGVSERKIRLHGEARGRVPESSGLPGGTGLQSVPLHAVRPPRLGPALHPGACYFFTIEFGLCKQEGQLRAYGAGLLSSIGELKHALSDKACVKAFDPKTTCLQECLITTFQEAYFVSESFEEAKEKMRDFAKSITRPFSVYFNPYTQSIEILKDTRSIENVVQDLRSDLNTVCDALNKMNQYLGI